MLAGGLERGMRAGQVGDDVLDFLFAALSRERVAGTGGKRLVTLGGVRIAA
jgi:hypothetical protein